MEEQESVYALFRVKLTAFLLIFGVGMIGGLLPMKLRVKGRLLALGNSLSGGVFLSAGLTHMLSEAAEQFDLLEVKIGNLPLAYFLCMCGMLFTFFLEKVAFHEHEHTHGSFDSHELEESSQENSRGIVKNGDAQVKTQSLNLYVLGAILSFHSVVEGIALGIENDTDGVNNILIAIIGHKIFDSFAFGVNLAKTNVGTKQLIQSAIIFSLATPIGILMGLFALQNSPNAALSAAIMALSSGTFIYIALVEVLLQEFESKKDRMLKFVLIVIGAILMSFLSHSHTHSHTHLHSD